ncbi:MAG: hypothetical protein ACOH1I_10795 [Gallionellaceae bacterium]
MRLDFNVLWVDDQINAMQSTRERIELLVKKEGFRLRVISASSIEGAKTYLSDDIYGDHIDLILMDLDLGAGGRGDQGLVEVRNLFPYKDIIFYSSQATDLLNLVANKKVQGVFCSTRDELANTVDGVFDALVKKVLDIDHSRGIVMGATSDIDHYVNDCLALSFESSDDKLKTAALAVVARHVGEKRKSIEKDLAKVAVIKHVTELQEFHNVYTSNDRLRLLKNVLQGEGSHDNSIVAIAEYLLTTVPKRNNLAHVRVKVNGFSRKLFDRDNIELTNEDMKFLRQELLEYQDLFEALFEKLRSSAPQAV